MNILLFIILIIFAAGWGLVRYLESTSVFFPSKEMNGTHAQFGLPYEDIDLTTVDGVRINAWFLRNPEASSTLIFAHGNAGTISDRLLKVKFFYDLGLNVLIFDYRGFGRSQGHPTEKGVYLDGQAAYDYLRTRKDEDIHRVIVYGSSLGGVVAVDLALHRPVALLIVDSSITNAGDMAQRLYPYLPTWLMGIKFDSISKVKRITALKLFMHSPDDQTIPYAMGRRLFEAAIQPKEFITTSGGHNEVQIVSDHKTSALFRQYLINHGFIQ